MKELSMKVSRSIIVILAVLLALACPLLKTDRIYADINNERIFFSSGANYIFKSIKSDGTNLFEYPSNVYGTVVSPNRQKITYYSHINNVANLFIADIDGSNPINLTPNSSENSVPYGWSPDNQKILFETVRNGISGTYVIDISTANIYMIAAHGYNAVWSPDGLKIAYFSADSSNARIFTVDSNGTNPVDMNTDGTYMTWSPDGSKLLVSGSQIVVVSRDGSNPIIVHPVSGSHGKPSWSPDGTKIAWVRWDPGSGCTAGGSMNIRVSAADGTQQKKVYCQNVDTTFPISWSPDSSELLTYVVTNIGGQLGSSLARLPSDSNLAQGGTATEVYSVSENPGPHVWLSTVNDSTLPSGTLGGSQLVLKLLGQTISGTAGDSTSGVSSVTVTVGTTNLVPGQGITLSCNSIRTTCTWAINSSLLPTGTNNVTLNVLDRAGNKASISKQYTVL